MTASADPTLLSQALPDAGDRCGHSVDGWPAAVLASADDPVPRLRGPLADRRR